jgi:hypothetical protein
LAARVMGVEDDVVRLQADLSLINRHPLPIPLSLPPYLGN